MNIYLVRHGESAANADRQAHRHLADHAVPLTELGIKQASAAGYFLADALYSELGSRRIRIWNSPYERTRQTAREIESALKYTLEKKSLYRSFDHYLSRREHIMLAEQQFGLFDGVPDEDLPKLFPAEHAHYKQAEDCNGRFWARMPLGESRFDVALRVHQAFGTFHRDSDKHKIHTIIVVCHGLTLRVFLQQWLHLPYEWVDEEPNSGNCWIRQLDFQGDRGYIFKGEIE